MLESPQQKKDRKRPTRRERQCVDKNIAEPSSTLSASKPFPSTELAIFIFHLASSVFLTMSYYSKENVL